MQLRRLAVRNVRSFESVDLSLSPGTTLLAGDVGAGKTSLLFAIEMALFGFAEVDPGFLVRHGSAEAEVALTLADADHTHEFRRRFRRRTSRGRESFQPVEGTYAQDGATRRYSATELRRRAIELVGFPDNPNPRAHSDLWRWAVFVPQERMRDVLDLEPNARLDTVRKALGIEQYRAAADNAQAVALELTQRSARWSAEAAGLEHFVDEAARWAEARHGAEEDLRAVEAERASLADEVAAVDRRWQDIERRWAARASAVSEMGQLETTRRRLRGQVESLDATLASLTARATELERSVGRLAEREARLAGTLEALDTTRGQREILLAAAAAADAAVGSLERTAQERAGVDAELATAERDAAAGRDRATIAANELRTAEGEGPQREPPAPTPRSLATIGEALTEADGERASARSAVAEAALERREVAGLIDHGTCPRCGQTVDALAFTRHRDEVEASLRTAERLLVEAEAKHTALDDERRARERYERAHLSWEAAVARRTVARARAMEAAERVAELEARVTTARARARTIHAEAGRLEEARATQAEHRRQLAAIERALSSLHEGRAAEQAALEESRAAGQELIRLHSDLARVRSDAAGGRAELGEVDRRRQVLEGALAEGPALEAERREIEGDRARARGRLDALQGRHGAAERTLHHADEQADRAATGLARLEKLRAQGRRESALGQWLGHAFRDALLGLEQQLLVRAHAEFSGVFARHFHTLVDDPALIARCDGAFAPAVEINGEWTPAEALSGGERTALALAYRLALGHVVRTFGQLHLDTIVLDEPTDGFSPEQVGRLGEVLADLGVGQIVLVSHEPGLASVADRVIRVEKVDGASRLEADAGVLDRDPPADAGSPPGTEGDPNALRSAPAS